jgi:hypothetical protein
MRTMRRSPWPTLTLALALALALAVALAPTAAAGSPAAAPHPAASRRPPPPPPPSPSPSAPSGRVVRVERTGISRIAPRLCDIHGDAGNCVGDEPRPGQIVVVLDEHHVVAEVQILEAASFSASCAMLWTVKTRTLRGSTVEGDGIGVIDPGLDPSRAHLIERAHLPGSPSGSPDDEVWRAIDRDGDGAADILITRYNCDASGRSTSTSVTSCLDLWARTGARMTRTTQLNFAQCNR